MIRCRSEKFLHSRSPLSLNSCRYANKASVSPLFAKILSQAILAGELGEIQRGFESRGTESDCTVAVAPQFPHPPLPLEGTELFQHDQVLSIAMSHLVLHFVKIMKIRVEPTSKILVPLSATTSNGDASPFLNKVCTIARSPF